MLPGGILTYTGLDRVTSSFQRRNGDGLSRFDLLHSLLPCLCNHVSPLSRIHDDLNIRDVPSL